MRVVARARWTWRSPSTLVPQRHEQLAERPLSRNGYREQAWGTRAGSIDLHVPPARDGSDSPSLLGPCRRGERSPVTVVQEAYLQGVSTRRVDDLVQQLGMTGISNSPVI